MKKKGVLVDVLVHMDMEKYGPDVLYEEGHKVLYLEGIKYIYGMLQ